MIYERELNKKRAEWGGLKEYPIYKVSDNWMHDEKAEDEHRIAWLEAERNLALMGKAVEVKNESC